MPKCNGRSLASSTAPSDYGLQCPCFCELTHAQFYGFPTTPNCATSTSADMTIEEHWIFCNYGHCPCASAPRSSSTGGSYCKCSDAAQMNGHVPGTACKAPLSCTSNNNCPGSKEMLHLPVQETKDDALRKDGSPQEGRGTAAFWRIVCLEWQCQWHVRMNYDSLRRSARCTAYVAYLDTGLICSFETFVHTRHRLKSYALIQERPPGTWSPCRNPNVR